MLILTACSNSQVATNTGKYKPIINTHPRYFLTIHATHSVPLSQLEVDVRQVAYNQRCSVVTNQLEGAKAYRSQDLIYYVKDNIKQRTLRIPLDHFKAGFCNWGVYSVLIKRKYNNLNDPIINLNVTSPSDTSKLHKKIVNIQVNCHNEHCIGDNKQMIPNYDICLGQNVGIEIHNEKSGGNHASSN